MGTQTGRTEAGSDVGVGRSDEITYQFEVREIDLAACHGEIGRLMQPPPRGYTPYRVDRYENILRQCIIYVVHCYRSGPKEAEPGSLPRRKIIRPA